MGWFQWFHFVPTVSNLRYLSHPILVKVPTYLPYVRRWGGYPKVLVPKERGACCCNFDPPSFPGASASASASADSIYMMSFIPRAVARSVSTISSSVLSKDCTARYITRSARTRPPPFSPLSLSLPLPTRDVICSAITPRVAFSPPAIIAPFVTAPRNRPYTTTTTANKMASVQNTK